MRWQDGRVVRFCSTGCINHATRAGYPAHPGGIVAGVDDRERLDRLPGMCSKEPMRVPTISRIRTWLVAGMERLWSQLKPVMDIDRSKPIEVTSVLGGLHVDYRRAA
jgi:hypothetical protein